MNKKYFSLVLTILLVLILAQSIQAQTVADIQEDLQHCWSMDDGVDDWNQSLNLTLVGGGASYNATGGIEGDGALSLDGASYANSGFKNIWDSTTGRSKTHCYAGYYRASSGGYSNWFGGNEVGGSFGVGFVAGTGISTSFVAGSNGQINTYEESSTALTAGAHYTFCVVYDDSVDLITTYLNNTNVTNTSDTNSGGTSTDTYNITMGARNDGGTPLRFLNGEIDWSCYWNRSLSGADINFVTTTHFGNNPNPASDEHINVSNYFPGANESFNTLSQPFNVTFNNTNTVTVRLWINGTLNQTNHSVSAGADNVVAFTIPFNISHQDELNYYFEINETEEGDNTTNRTFWIDNIFPVLTNNTNVSYNLAYEFLWSNFTLSDVNLYSYNLTWCGNELANNTLTGQTSITLEEGLSMDGCAAGNNTLNVLIADGHTAEKIKDYSWRKQDNGKSLYYDFGNNGFVKLSPKNQNDYESLSTTKKKDRYEFNLVRKSKPNPIEEFYVESQGYIDIIKDSKYRGHLVMPKENKWVDFEHAGPGKVRVTRLAPNKVLVRVHSLKSRDLKFNSIGDLNIINETYTFWNLNATETFETSVAETENINYFLNLSYDSSFVSSSVAGINVNGTWFEPTQTTGSSFIQYNFTFPTSIIGSEYNLTHYWDFNITGVVSDISNQTNITNTTVSSISIDNCSVLTTYALNFTLHNESDNSEVSGILGAFFEYWTDDSQNNISQNLTWAQGTEFGVCISPSEAQFNFNAQLEYEATGFNLETYYFDVDSMSNTTQEIDLLLSDPGEASLVSFMVRDQNDDPVENVFIHILAYDPSTDSNSLSEIIKTGSDGQAVGHIVLNTQFYNFILYKDNAIILQSQNIILTSQTQTFNVDLTADYFDTYTIVRGVSCDLSYDNDTRTFTYIFSDSTNNVTSACLQVTEQSIFATNVINNTCSSSSSGTISVTHSATTGNSTFIGLGQIQIGTQTFPCGGPTSASFNEGFSIDGPDGIFYTNFLLMFLAMLGVWNYVVSIVLVMIGIGLSLVLGTLELSWGIMISIFILGALFVYRINKK